MALDSTINYQDEFGDIKTKCNLISRCSKEGLSSDECPVVNKRIVCRRGTLYLSWTEYIVLNNGHFTNEE